MLHHMNAEWQKILPQDILSLGEQILQTVALMRSEGIRVWPEKGNEFRAFELTPPNKIKAVIVGQDPYHNPGEAHGLAFSVPSGVKIPSSLQNIFKELHADIGCQIPQSGDLTSWAEQGVLLLNTVLTVEEGKGDKANSHRKLGWEDFTQAVISATRQLEQPVAYILWGGQARAFCSFIDTTKNNRFSVFSSHPSGLSAYRTSDTVPAFMGSRPFSQVNRWLESHGVEPIDWEIPKK